jgi:hypothetical protein
MINPDRVLRAVSATKAGDAKTVRMMLKAGVPANHFVAGLSETDRCSLAHFAAKHGQFEIFEFLVEAGAGIDEPEQVSWRPAISMLECACSANSPSLEIIRKILKEGHPTQTFLDQSLQVAAYGHSAIVEELLAAGANANCSDLNLDTPLIVAVLSDQEDIAIRLVEADADATLVINNKDRAPFWRKTVLDAVIKKGMNRLLSKIKTADGAATTASTTKRVRRPKTIEECWLTIDQWLASNAQNIRFPPPFDWLELKSGLELLQSPAAEQVRSTLSFHDGTGDFSIIVMLDDASYTLLSVNDALSRDASHSTLQKIGPRLAARDRNRSRQRNTQA